jgi:hypothetical protein
MVDGGMFDGSRGGDSSSSFQGSTLQGAGGRDGLDAAHFPERDTVIHVP